MVTTKTKSDADIQRAVTAEMEWTPLVDPKEFTIQVKHGIVTLKGLVSSYARKLAARKAAHRVEGVLDVVDELQVKESHAVVTDQNLAEAVRNALTWDVYVPDKRIKSTVSDGWVTLEGEVERYYERDDAGRAVENMTGVRGVTNAIVVKPKLVESAQIRTTIQNALARRAERGAKRVKVDVVGSTVKLSGTVDSWAEKDALENVVHYSPGVSKVDSSIHVDPCI